MVEINRRMFVAFEKERKASAEQEQLMKKVKDPMEKVRESEAARAKAEEEAVSLETTYDTTVRQLMEAKDVSKKSLKA